MKQAALILCTLCTYLIPFTGRSQPADFAQKTDSLLDYLYQHNRFCGTVLITKGDAVLYDKTFIAAEAPHTEHSYRIASITKMFTAVLIYQLAEEQKLSLDDKLSKYFPEIEYADEITLKQMLGHQSGIRDLINNDDFSSIKTDTLSREQLVQLITSYKPAFKPGEKTQYSNSNYLLLGYIIEDITKMPYNTVLATRITKKTGLSHTYLETADTSPGRIRNKAYIFNGENWVPESSETNASVSGAAGAMVSTPDDLDAFLHALFHEDLISAASLDSMCVFTNKTYGHGIFYTPYNKHKGYGHTGHIDEFRSAATFFPDDSLAFILCLNGLNYPMNDIALGVLEYYFENKFSLPDLTTIEMDEATLKQYEGIYRLKLFHLIPVTKVKIASEHGVLATATVQDFETDKVIAEPVAIDTFKNFQYHSVVEFVRKKNGNIKGCYVDQGKTRLYCRKLKRSS